eukprot:s64_g18.t1
MGKRQFVEDYRSPMLVHPYALTFIGDTLYASTQDSGTVMSFDIGAADKLSSGDRIHFNLHGDFRYRPGITYRGIASYKECLYLSVTEMDVVAVICNNLTHVSHRIPVRHPIGPSAIVWEGLLVDEEQQRLYIASPTKQKHEPGEIAVWDLESRRFRHGLTHESGLQGLAAREETLANKFFHVAIDMCLACHRLSLMKKVVTIASIIVGAAGVMLKMRSSRCAGEHHAVPLLALVRASTEDALHKQYGHRVINVSRSGANTGTTKERFREVVAPLRPDVVIIALSLGNEGLAHCRPGERRAAQHRYEQGLLDLISMTLALDAMPILGGVYPNNDFNAETYSMLKETARTMSRWDIPVLDWLGSLDDGRGRWKEGLWFDHAHPNTEGQRRMFECIDLALFESRGATERDIPVLVRRRSSLTQFDAAERQTSYSSLDQVLQASQQAEAHGSREAVGPPTFDDGRGFSVVLCRGAISIRNKTRHEYILSPEWKELTRALRTAGLRPGIYIANDDCCRNHRVLFVNAEGHLSRRLVLPPGADALYLPSFLPGTGGQDR